MSLQESFGSEEQESGRGLVISMPRHRWAVYLAIGSNESASHKLKS